jgi:hypothetical protein
MDSRLWTVVAPALAGHHTVVRYDARGLGRSSAPEQPYRDVDDLAAVLDHVDIDRAATGIIPPSPPCSPRASAAPGPRPTTTCRYALRSASSTCYSASVRFHDLWPLGLKIEAVISAKIDSTYD